MAPRVSVIIPVYNGDRFITQAIDSVLQQTYTNYEIIVVDDGSTDNTQQVLQPYLDKIQYLNQLNQGSASARNLGIKAATGELIAFLDADDFFLLQEKLEEQVDDFDHEPSLGCLQTGWQQVDQNGQTLAKIEPWHQAPTLDLETWLVWKPVRMSTMMIRRHWLERINGFDAELRQSHDVDLVLRLAVAGCKSGWLRKITTSYRYHENNTTGNAPVQAKYLWLVMNKFFSQSNIPQSIRQREHQIRYETLVWIAWYQYHTGHLEEMLKYLKISLSHTPYLRTETILDWTEKFLVFCSINNGVLNIDSLTSSLEWQQIVNQP